MKIYTKTGDAGETGLIGGVRVSKSHRAVQVCGDLDETNCLIGLAISQSPPPQIVPPLSQIQNDLFDLGSRIAACESSTSRQAEFLPARTTQLEHWIDHFDSELSPLKEFILPGGGLSGATLHVARSVGRRSERNLVALIETGVMHKWSVELMYLNRLSDLLFVLARYANHIAGAQETPWVVTRSSATTD